MSPEIARKVVVAFRKVQPPESELNLSPRQLRILQLLAEGHSYRSGEAVVPLTCAVLRTFPGQCVLAPPAYPQRLTIRPRR